MLPPPNRSNRRLLWPYALPYAAYVGIAALPGEWLAREASYALRIAATGGLLLVAWRSLMPLRGPRSPVASVGIGLAVGLLATALWIAMLQPLVGRGGEPWGDRAFLLRLVASGTLVPVFEELLMRGYVLGVAVQWDLARQARERDPLGRALDRSFHDLAPGAATPIAVAISSLVFAAGHAVEEYPAAFAYGLIMAALWVVRRDLISCVSAHAATNVALALYVRQLGVWTLW